MFVHFLLTTVIAAVMYAGGERGAATAILFGRRFGGDEVNWPFGWPVRRSAAWPSAWW